MGAEWRSWTAAFWPRLSRYLEHLANGSDVTEASLLRERVAALEAKVAEMTRLNGDRLARNGKDGVD